MQVYVYHAHLCEIYAFCGVFIIRASLKTPFEKKQLCTTSAASTSLGVRQHAFNGMADNTAFAQTNIYKNGKLYDYLVAGVKTGGSGSNTTQNQWIDYEFDLNGESAVYEFECIDVCGNISQKSSYKVTPDNTNNLADEKNANAEKPVNWEFTDLDHIEYTISGDSIRITGFDNTVENLVIPDKIEGLPVTVIDWYAFENCYNLKSVTIPDTVTHISRFAFAHCTALETVNMPKSLYSIEQYAFFNCPKLKGINLPENLAVIEQRAFSGCKSITEITIPKACTNVGEYAFLNCDSSYTIAVNSENTMFDTCSMGYSYNNGYGIKSGFSIDSTTAARIRLPLNIMTNVISFS